MTIATVDVPTIIRPMEAGDISFVWETSLKVRQPRAVAWGDWLAAAGKRFGDDMQAPGVMIRVMEHDGVLVGFVWKQQPRAVVQMLYVKRDLRGFGYGIELLGRPDLDDPPSVVNVHAPNLCWRKWALSINLAWKEKF